jgi:hypothetical protein
VAVFCVSVAETLVGKPVFENHRTSIVIVFAGAGIAAWFLGRHVARRRSVFGLASGDPPEAKQFSLLDLRYGGSMLLVFGIITLFIRPLRPITSEEMHAPAATLTKTNAPVVFPALKLQGIFFRKSRPLVIINGDSYAVGDRVGNATVKAITRTSVVLELDGELKCLTLY